MVKALELYTDTDLTPLQRAAVARIKEFKQELAGYGLMPRSAMELEFTTEDEHGMPASRTMSLCNGGRFNGQNPALDALRELFPASEATYVQNLRFEYTHSEGSIYDRGQAEVPYQYEINIADPMISGGNPEKVAAITEDIRKTKLQDLMKRGTCLQNPNLKIYANLSVRPYYGNELVAQTNRIASHVTSALHVNVSLFDKKGNNALASNDVLLSHCAESLLQLQNSAGLSMLPHSSSLARFEQANNSVPKKIIGLYETNNDSGKKGASVHIRRSYGNKTLHPSAAQQVRLENRLPGADADPFVAMAVTLAALVDGVRKYRANIPKPVLSTFDIPVTHEEIRRKFESAKNAKDLLGAELYNAIREEYAQRSTAQLSNAI